MLELRVSDRTGAYITNPYPLHQPRCVGVNGKLCWWLQLWYLLMPRLWHTEVSLALTATGFGVMILVLPNIFGTVLPKHDIKVMVLPWSCHEAINYIMGRYRGVSRGARHVPKVF